MNRIMRFLRVVGIIFVVWMALGILYNIVTYEAPPQHNQCAQDCVPGDFEGDPSSGLYQDG